MSHHDFSLSGIPNTAYLGSTIPDGSTGISAAYARDITLHFNQSVEPLSATDAELLGTNIPTLTVTATPKGGSTQTLVENIDFVTDSVNRLSRLFLYNRPNMITYPMDQFVDKFGFEGLTVDNVSDYFINGIFYTNVVKPDTTYTITYSPNYF